MEEKTKVLRVAWVYLNFVIINNLERIFKDQVGWEPIIRDKFTVGWCVSIGWVYLIWIIVDYFGKVIVGLYSSISLGIFNLKIIVCCVSIWHLIPRIIHRLNCCASTIVCQNYLVVDLRRISFIVKNWPQVVIYLIWYI